MICCCDNRTRKGMVGLAQASGASRALEPHYGTHAAQAAVAQLSLWINSQLGQLSGSSQPSTSTSQQGMSVSDRSLHLVHHVRAKAAGSAQFYC